MLLTPRSPQDDQSALVRIIQEIFDRSPLFQKVGYRVESSGPYMLWLSRTSRAS